MKHIKITCAWYESLLQNEKGQSSLNKILKGDCQWTIKLYIKMYPKK